MADERLVDPFSVEAGDLRAVAAKLLQQQLSALLHLLPRQLGGPLGGSGAHIGEANAPLQHPEVVVAGDGGGGDEVCVGYARPEVVARARVVMPHVGRGQAWIDAHLRKEKDAIKIKGKIDICEIPL